MTKSKVMRFDLLNLTNKPNNSQKANKIGVLAKDLQLVKRHS